MTHAVALILIVAYAPATDFSGKVVRVADGDTIEVLVNNRQVRVRLFGVDAPELHQPFGNRARQGTSELTFGKTVTVRVNRMDEYGRVVGEVILPDGASLNQELVRRGLAWWYRHYAPQDKQLEALEAEARRAKRGLWADARPIEPWVWRQSSQTYQNRQPARQRFRPRRYSFR
jgi:micrococcal nuclease